MTPQAHSFTLLSPLRPEECVARLQEAVIPSRYWAWLYLWPFRKSLLGVLGVFGWCVRTLYPPFSIYRQRLTATLQPHGEGTRLNCCIAATSGMLPALVLAIGMFLMGLVMSIVWVVNLTRGGSIWEDWWAAPLVAVTSLLIWKGHRDRATEAEFLTQVVVAWLEAQRENPTAFVIS